MKNILSSLVILFGTLFFLESCIQRPINTYPTEIVLGFKNMPTDQQVESIKSYYNDNLGVVLEFKKREPTCQCSTNSEFCCLYQLSAPIKKGGGSEEPDPTKFLIFNKLPIDISKILVQAELKFMYYHKSK